jgi:hypothetical protein
MTALAYLVSISAGETLTGASGWAGLDVPVEVAVALPVGVEVGSALGRSFRR